MKKTALWKDIFREIKNSPGRFISIVLLITLGVFVYTGLKSVGPLMRKTADTFINETKLTDIYINSQFSLEDKDKDILKSVTDIKKIEYVYSEDMLEKGSEAIVNLESLPEKISMPKLVEGRLPEKNDEIVVDAYPIKNSFNIGDIIEFDSKKSKFDFESKKILKNYKFKIVGKVVSAENMSTVIKGNSKKGLGDYDSFAYVLKSAFNDTDESKARIIIKGLDGLKTTDREYKDKVSANRRKLISAFNERSTERFESIKADKQFNMQDLNEQILLDQDMGFGPKYINFERKIEYNTIAKEAIKIKSKTELLSEEMRLLYVALTRAKEKIIITGVEKDLQKALENKQKELDMYDGAQKIPLNLVKKSKTYLDWLEYVYLFNKEKNIIEFNKIVLENEKTKEENDNKKEKKIDVIKDISKEQKEEVNKKLTWKYKYIESTKIEGKTSVSAIAKYGEKNIQIVEKPKFMQNIEILNKAEIGTLMHLILQKLDFRENYNEKTLNDLIQKLIYLNIVTEKQSQYIDKKRLLEFTKTELFKEIQNAKEIYKEQPFHMSVIDENTKESILIQGIIDLYYINQNNEIVLVDYKTDYVEKNNEQELIEKYKPQLKIYKKAIEEALNKNVEKVYIYSVYLNKEILVK